MLKLTRCIRPYCETCRYAKPLSARWARCVCSLQCLRSLRDLLHAKALKFLGAQDPANAVPWQRVVSSSGTISSRGPGTNGADLQRQALEAEGVDVTRGRTGDLRVDFTRYGWFPEPGTVTLPDRTSGEGEAGDDEDE
jgi:hypothetical protein